MIMDPRNVILLPLKPFGLEPGHALSNARPTALQVHAWREEQRAYINREYRTVAKHVDQAGSASSSSSQ
jgi:hypothetical protein